MSSILGSVKKIISGANNNNNKDDSKKVDTKNVNDPSSKKKAQLEPISTSESPKTKKPDTQNVVLTPSTPTLGPDSKTKSTNLTLSPMSSSATPPKDTPPVTPQKDLPPVMGVSEKEPSTISIKKPKEKKLLNIEQFVILTKASPRYVSLLCSFFLLCLF